MAPVNVECPIEDCDYTATHAEAAVVAAMLSVHATEPRKSPLDEHWRQSEYRLVHSSRAQALEQ